MLKAETLKELASRAGCSEAELKRTIGTDVEETLSFDTEGEFITHTDLESIKERAGKEKYTEGKKAGEEMFGKELKRITGLEFEGRNAEKVITAIKEKALEEAKVEPTKRITELEEDKKKLQQAVKDAEEKLTAETEVFNKKLTHVEIDALIKSALPEKLANGLTRDQLYKVYKSDREFTKTPEGIALVNPTTKEVIKDKKLNPVSIADDLKEFIAQFGEVEPGRGGGDGKQQKKTNIESFTKRSEVEKYCSDNEIPLSEQAGVLAKAMKNEGFKITE